MTERPGRCTGSGSHYRQRRQPDRHDTSEIMAAGFLDCNGVVVPVGTSTADCFRDCDQLWHLRLLPVPSGASDGVLTPTQLPRDRRWGHHDTSNRSFTTPRLVGVVTAHASPPRADAPLRRPVIAGSKACSTTRGRPRCLPHAQLDRKRRWGCGQKAQRESARLAGRPSSSEWRRRKWQLPETHCCA